MCNYQPLEICTFTKPIPCHSPINIIAAPQDRCSVFLAIAVDLKSVGFATGIWSQQLSFGHSLNTADSQDFTLSIYGVVAWTAKIDSVASIDDLVFV